MLLQKLEDYNRRERNYVANYCLSDKCGGSLVLHKDFIDSVEKAIGCEKIINRKEYYAAIEYNFDWLYASLENYKYNNSFYTPRLRTNDSFIKGKQNRDIDLLIVSKNGDKYDFYLIEAKYKQGWFHKKSPKKQIDEKIKLMIYLYTNISCDAIGDVYYIFYSRNNTGISNYMNNLGISFPNFKGFFGIQPPAMPKTGVYINLLRNTTIESSILIEHAVNGKLSFNNMAAQFKNQLHSEEVNIGSDYFISIDYTFSNLFKSFSIGTNAKGSTDVDLLIVDKKNNNVNENDCYKFVFLEAKAYTRTKGDPDQIINKLFHIDNFINARNNISDEYYFIIWGINPNACRGLLMGQVIPTRLNIICMPCTFAKRFQSQRCDVNGKENSDGYFWNKL